MEWIDSDVGALVALVHGRCLRMLSTSLKKSQEGLSVAAGAAKKAGKISQAERRRMIQIDAAFHITWHISQPKCMEYITALEAELLGTVKNGQANDEGNEVKSGSELEADNQVTMEKLHGDPLRFFIGDCACVSVQTQTEAYLYGHHGPVHCYAGPAENVAYSANVADLAEGQEEEVVELDKMDGVTGEDVDSAATSKIAAFNGQEQLAATNGHEQLADGIEELNTHLNENLENVVEMALDPQRAALQKKMEMKLPAVPDFPANSCGSISKLEAELPDTLDQALAATCNAFRRALRGQADDRDRC